MRGEKKGGSKGKESKYLSTYIPEVTKRVSICSLYLLYLPSLILYNYLTYRTVPKV